MKKEKFKSKNGVALVGEKYIAKEGELFGGKEIWEIKKLNGDDSYIDMMTNSIGKMYSLSLGEVKTFEDYINIWKKRYIFPNLKGSVRQRENPTKGYMVDLYGISKEEFKELIKNIKFLLDKNCKVHYNDEHGVGYFEKKGKKYLATHCRYGNLEKEDITIKGIGIFLRSFFDLGYTYDKKDDWKEKN